MKCGTSCDLNSMRSRTGSRLAWYEAIDFCHLIERLGEALELIDCQSRQWQLQLWRQSLVEDDTAIDAIASYLRFIARMPRVPKSARNSKNTSPISKTTTTACAIELCVQQGMPIGSGITESACKTVVNMRAKGAGQRWSVPGLRGTLHLRALNASDRFDAFWAQFSRLHVANVNNCAHAA